MIPVKIANGENAPLPVKPHSKQFWVFFSMFDNAKKYSETGVTLFSNFLIKPQNQKFSFIFKTLLIDSFEKEPYFYTKSYAMIYILKLQFVRV